MLLSSRFFGRRPSRLLTFVPILALLLAEGPASAEAPDEAKRHFTNGVHFFEDRNFAGALVEFEASFRANPTAVALQNIAVCQKGLFRYADAIATLDRMLREFGAQLSPEDKKAAEDAIRDMTALLGTIVVRATPADARISINDAQLSADGRQRPIPLAAGEYRVVAEAPGFARQEKMVTVVSGQKDVPLVLTLVPLSGTLVIRAHDPQAAIAIDGVQVGYDEWKGPVSAGTHEVYVYTSARSHKSNVVASAGQTTEFEAKLGAEDAVPAGKAASANAPPPYIPPSQRGLYGFLTFGGDLMNTAAPEGLTNSKARTGGGFGSLRVGYRFSTLLGAEFLAESSTRDFDAFDTATPGTTGQYTFSSTRIGPALRLMTNGAKGRFVTTVGLGAAVHGIAYKKGVAAGRSDQSGAGAFFQLTGGYELSLGHFLVDAGLHLTAENADPKKVGVKNATSIGLEFRVGYGTW